MPPPPLRSIPIPSMPSTPRSLSKPAMPPVAAHPGFEAMHDALYTSAKEAGPDVACVPSVTTPEATSPSNRYPPA